MSATETIQLDVIQIRLEHLQELCKCQCIKNCAPNTTKKQNSEPQRSQRGTARSRKATWSANHRRHHLKNVLMNTFFNIKSSKAHSSIQDVCRRVRWKAHKFAAASLPRNSPFLDEGGEADINVEMINPKIFNRCDRCAIKTDVASGIQTT